MFELICKGGVLMAPIILCSVISITIIIERAYHLWRARIDTSKFFPMVKEYLQRKRMKEALKLCQETTGPVAQIIAAGIQSFEKGVEERERVIAQTGSHELRRLEKNLRGLSVIAHISPLLGLFGTVLGMIKAFMKIQELGGKVDASVLAGGIWEALITTAAGLAVAIPTMVAYYYFEGRVDDFAAQMKEAALELFKTLGLKHLEVQTEIGHPIEDEEYGV